MSHPWYRLLFEEMPCLGALSVSALSLVAVFAAGHAYYRIREAAERPLRERRDRNDKAAHVALAPLDLDWFAVSSNRTATQLNISCLVDPARLPEIQHTVATALAAVDPSVSVRVHDASQLTPSSFPDAASHLTMLSLMASVDDGQADEPTDPT